MFDWHDPWEGLFIEPAWGLGSVRLNEQIENASQFQDMQYLRIFYKDSLVDDFCVKV